MLWDHSNSDVIGPCLFIRHVAQPEDAVTGDGRKAITPYLASAPAIPGVSVTQQSHQT